MLFVVAPGPIFMRTLADLLLVIFERLVESDIVCILFHLVQIEFQSAIVHTLFFLSVI